MREALKRAARGAGRVEPNPMVGAVLVKHGKLIGQGFHAVLGGEHAEWAALRDAQARGENPQEATCYVTLEPCVHYGRTPPCTDALIQAGVTRVVAAMIDPDPRVAGGGVEALRQAGITVEVGLLNDQAARLNAAFVKRRTRGLPLVTCKWAMTLDGYTADAQGISKWISNPTSRQRVHELRARVDAIFVGIGTVLADDPRLTARDVEVLRPARRVVLDPALQLPPKAALLTEPGPPLTLATSHPHDPSRPDPAWATRADIDILRLPVHAGAAPHLDLEPLLRHLADQYDASHVLCEGGASLTGSLIDQNLCDRLLVFIAPSLLGDPRAVPCLRSMTPREMPNARRLRLHDVQQLDGDVMLEYDII